MARTLHFKSKEAYRKWTAYGQMHGEFRKAAGHSTIFVRGKKINPKHARS